MTLPEERSTRRIAVITGCHGGIGAALVRTFRQAGHTVVGLDVSERAAADSLPDVFIPCDLSRVVSDTAYRDGILTAIRKETSQGLSVLINNAAHQVVKPLESLEDHDWTESFNVNVTAPFVLIRALLPDLARAGGNVLNIGSIHHHLTKPDFVAYATTKSAIVGMTRAMAVELGARVRFNVICPAAISTPMLEAGFEGKSEKLGELRSMHPTGTIGTVEEVSKAALFLTDGSIGFLNGAVLNLDGGIGARLHDPA